LTLALNPESTTLLKAQRGDIRTIPPRKHRFGGTLSGYSDEAG
jgi:hypothetical protein